MVILDAHDRKYEWKWRRCLRQQPKVIKIYSTSTYSRYKFYFLCFKEQNQET